MTEDQRFYAKYRGVVISNAFDELGRIEVNVPSVMGKSSTMWAMPCVPYAGPDAGMIFIPDEGVNVWVEFEDGDPSYPIWTGCFWKDGDLTSLKVEPHVKLIKTKDITITIDDNAGSIKIENGLGTCIEIAGTKITGDASAEIVNQVKAMKTKLGVTGFDVHDGAMSVS